MGITFDELCKKLCVEYEYVTKKIKKYKHI